MRHRATQLILPFEPALPGRQLILAPRLWPTMTPTTQQQLAKRVAQLVRSMLAAASRPLRRVSVPGRDLAGLTLIRGFTVKRSFCNAQLFFGDNVSRDR